MTVLVCVMPAMRRPTEHAHGHDVPLHHRRRPRHRVGFHRRRPHHPLRVAPRRVLGVGLGLGLGVDHALAAPGVVKGSGVSGDG